MWPASGGITPWIKVAHLAEGFLMCRCVPSFLMELHAEACARPCPTRRGSSNIPQLDDLDHQPASAWMAATLTHPIRQAWALNGTGTESSNDKSPINPSKGPHHETSR